ncbi:MAG: MarC family protein [Pseudomonadota bacterium]
MDTVFLMKVAGGLFAIMNPFTNLPIFLSLTQGQSDSEIRRTALGVLAGVAAMCTVVALAGQAILALFDIGVDEFRLAGGLVVLTIGLGMLNGQDSSAHHGTKAEQAHHDELAQIAFYPMTFPILVGPGSITTILVFAGEADGAAQTLAFWVGLGGVTALLGVVLLSASVIGHMLGQTLRVVMTRLMGMILAAIAVGMIATGAKALLPGLAG